MSFVLIKISWILLFFYLCSDGPHLLSDVFQNMNEFEGHKLQSLTKEGLKFGDEDEDTIKKRTKAYKESFKTLTKYMKDKLVGKVGKVTVSQRVEKSPAVIVTSQYGHTANMERIMRAQTFANQDNIKAMAAQKTLELNPRHPLINELNKMVQESPDDENTKDMVTLIYDAAIMTSGFIHDDADNFAMRMYRTMANSMNVKSMELLDEIEVSFICRRVFDSFMPCIHATFSCHIFFTP